MSATITSPPAAPAGAGPLDLIASCMTLSAIAVTLPLLDLLGRNPEFFVVHDIGGSEIVVLAVLGAVVVPLLLGGLAALVAWVYRPAGLVLHGVVLAVLAGTIAVVLLKGSPLDGLPWWAYGLIALAAGGVAVYSFHRIVNVRWLLRVGMVVPLLLVGLFLFGSRVSALVLPAELSDAGVVAIPEDAPPIVMLVFDELPLASLIDGEGRIQPGPYPNLAKLADDATWYRDTTTVASHTTWAVPAILTGKVADADAVPTIGDHPDNLFTWGAAAGYDLRVVEPVTELCPESLCGDALGGRIPVVERWRSLWSDFWVVAGHVFLPDGFADRLPPIDQNWSNFAGGEEAVDQDWSNFASDSEEFVMKDRFAVAIGQDRRRQVSALLDLIGPPGPRPSLYFGHFLLPHAPWQYLPDGRLHNAIGIDNAGAHPSWSDDTWAVAQSYQRHLAQTEYVDHIVGQVVARLEEAGIYDEAIVVVAADHGIAIRPGVAVRRRLSADSVADVAAVPLIVKASGQDQPMVDDYPASLIDVLPTIVALAGSDLPWEVEGISLVEPDRPDRPTRSVAPATGRREPIVYASPRADVIALGESRVELFGDGGVFGMAPPGQRDLLGQAVGDLVVGPDQGLGAQILNGADYVEVDLAADVLPVVVRGELAGHGAPEEVVAIAVNGTVSAVTLTYRIEGEEGIHFAAMLDPGHLVDGRNHIELFLVTVAGAGRSLQPMVALGIDG